MIKVKNYCLIILLFVVMAIFCLISAIPEPEKVYAETITISQEESQIFCDADSNDNYDVGSVLVVFTREESGINKNHSQKFENIDNIKDIIDLTFIEGNALDKDYLNLSDFHQILKIELILPSKQNVLDMIEQIEQIEGVLWVGVNSTCNMESSSTAMTVSEISETDLWGLYGNYGINVEGAWNYSTGSSNIKVGIIDSGIANHPDLNQNLGIGWDFYNDNNITNDDIIGHGTYVAGVIGASTIGINKNVKLIPLQVVENGVFNLDAVVEAITYATNNNINILNYSAGNIYEHESIKNAINNYKGLFICSAGNNTSDNDKIIHYPSDYSRGQSFSNRVISVGALTENGTKRSNSNYGKESVSIFAPGEGIITTGKDNDYKSVNDTSMASAFVSGVAALMLSLYDETPNNFSVETMASNIKSIIIEESSRNSNLSSFCVAKGHLDANDSVTNMNVTDTISADIGYNGSEYHWNGQIDMSYDNIHVNKCSSQNTYEIKEATQLHFDVKSRYSYNYIAAIDGSINYELKDSSGSVVKSHSTTVNVDILNNVSIGNERFTIDTLLLPNDDYTLTIKTDFKRMSWNSSDVIYITLKINQESCVAEGSMITLADGTQKAVEDLTGEEELLVWNMITGEFDSAPIVFIDSDPESYYEVINLYFSDGTTVKVISEHAFWDINLNKYVYLRSDAAQYIGHWFNKQTINENGDMVNSQVQLTDVVVEQEYTSAWSPVTYGHLCYYVNGMLSMPGGITGLINIFEVDPETMTIDQEKYLEDIEKYGLFTYEEFNALCPIPEDVFNAFNGQYLKVSMGKGLITLDKLEVLISKYAKYFN